MLGNPRLELGKNVQVRRDSVARVHIVMVLAMPGERLAAFYDLDAGGIDRAGAEQVPSALGEIIADHANHANRMAGIVLRLKITGRRRNKRGAAA